MLKIKDDLDLKELEKYDFELKTDKVIEKYQLSINDKGYNQAYIIVMPITRKLIIDTHATFISDKLTIIYDLIEAGLVEKVEDR